MPVADRSPGHPSTDGPTSADASAVAVGLVVEVGAVPGAVGVPVAEGGGVPLSVPVGVEDTVAESPVAGGVVGGAGVFWAVAVEAVEGTLLGDVAGSAAGARGRDAGLVWLAPGLGRGLSGFSSVWSWGSRKKPTVRPATCSTAT